jgi:hypothetical protein
MDALLGWGIGSCCGGYGSVPGRKPQGVLTKPRREFTGPNMAGSTAELLRCGGRMDSGGAWETRVEGALGWLCGGPGMGRLGSENLGMGP